MDRRSAIFVNYRRDDTADVSARIHDRLVSAFGHDAVFFDVDHIPIGVDFTKHIESVLAGCRCLLAIIGPNWLEAKDSSGGRRLSQADDFVRKEIEGALRLEVQVIPILVNDADMPLEVKLPSSIASISTLQASRVRRNPDFHKDMDTLIAALRDGALSGFVSVLSSEPDSAATAIWKELSASENSYDLRTFADQFPGTREGWDARRAADSIDSNEAIWKNTRRNAIPSIESFLTSYPNHPRRREAEQLLSELGEKLTARWQALRQSNEIESLRRFKEEAAGAPEQALAADRIEYLQTIEPLEERALTEGALKAILIDASGSKEKLDALDARWTQDLKQIEAAMKANKNRANEERLNGLQLRKQEQLRSLAVAQRALRSSDVKSARSTFHHPQVSSSSQGASGCAGGVVLLVASGAMLALAVWQGASPT